MNKSNQFFSAKIFSKKIGLCILFSLFATVRVFSFEEFENNENIFNDTIVTLDSSTVSDDKSFLDSNISGDKIKQVAKNIFKQNKNIGSLLIENSSINFREITRINYATKTEILQQEQISFPLFTGLLGNNNALSFYSATPNENSLLLNGVQLFNIYGSENFNIVSPEFSNQIEILKGSKSAILTGKTGATVNVQTPIFNAGNPYSRIWFTQGDNKLLGVDGTYSQNFLPNWNLTTGFRRLSANSYYRNSFFDSWNARIMLRNNLSDLQAISFLYHFSNYHTGDFGGIFFPDFNTNNNQQNLVRPNFDSLRSRQYRTDLIFSHSILTKDSNLTVNSNLFFNHNENNIFFRNEKELLKLDSTGKNISHTVNYGINSNLKYFLTAKTSFDFGGEIFYVKIPNSVITKEFNGFGTKLFASGITEISSLKLFFGGRFANKYDKNLVGIGGNISIFFNEKSKIYLDISYSDSEPIPVLDYNFENHFLGLLGFETAKNKFSFDVNLFFRQINNSLLLNFSQENLYSFLPSVWGKDNHHIFGLTGKINFELPKNFDFSFTVQNFFDNTQFIPAGKAKPKFYFSPKIQYSYFKGTSEVRGGLKGSFLVNSRKLYYNPIFRNYGFSDLESSFASDGLTAFISAKFGNAFVRADFKNILGTNFSYLAYYPILKQEVCLSLTWAFPSK